MRKLDFLSSLAIGHLIAAFHNIRTHGGTTVLAAPQRHVLESLRKVKLHELVEIVGSVNEAIVNAD